MLLGKERERESGVQKRQLRPLWIEKERWVKLQLRRQWRDGERWERLQLRHLRLEKEQKRMKMPMMKTLLGKGKERERGVPKSPLRHQLKDKERWERQPLRR